ncbi:hypothetical protein C8R46DRAFT_1027974 [Mycena filopes]|nr:hypothetical protein C8R46DRAFT_1027974 [Mycena filopes]
MPSTSEHEFKFPSMHVRNKIFKDCPKAELKPSCQYYNTNGTGQGPRRNPRRAARVGTGSGIMPTPVVNTPDPLECKIMYWNIHHEFTLKLTDSGFQQILSAYDIMFLAETDMLPGEEDAADVPKGYTLLSLPRKPIRYTKRRGGGIALLVLELTEVQRVHTGD